MLTHPLCPMFLANFLLKSSTLIHKASSKLPKCAKRPLDKVAMKLAMKAVSKARSCKGSCGCACAK